MTAQNVTAHKRCARCGQHLPLSDFLPDRAKKDGRGSYCRNCARAHRAAHYWTPERLAQRIERDRKIRERLALNPATLAAIARNLPGKLHTAAMAHQ